MDSNLGVKVTLVVEYFFAPSRVVITLKWS